MHEARVRFSSCRVSDRGVRYWRDPRFRVVEGKPRPRVGRASRYLMYLGLAIGLCVLLAFAGCGTSTPIGELRAAQTAVNFGAVAVGQSGTATVSFVNSGTGAVEVSKVTITGQPFRIAGHVSFPASVAAGATLSLPVEFTPTKSGEAAGTVTLAADVTTGQLPSVSLSGLGVQAITEPGPASTAALDGISCKSTTLTGAGSDSCSVVLSAVASSGMTVSLSSNNPAISVPGTVTVPANATSVAFTVTVAAVTSAETAVLTASANGVSEQVAIQLNPLESILSASAANVGFGNVSVNSQMTQTLILTSTGGLPVTISGAIVTGTGFSLGGIAVPVTLNPGQSITLDLGFMPTAVGNEVGQLTVTSNATSGATIVVTLGGTGAIGYQVNLTWNAPATSADAVSGYHVYRSAAGASSYQLLSSTVLNTTVFTDSAIQGGQTYNYFVTSVDGSGVESTHSNTYTVTIP